MNHLTDGDRIMRPRININGMSSDQHIQQRIDIMTAVRDTIRSLSEIRPHGRDYLGDSEAYQRDLKIHAERIMVLDKLYNEIHDEALAIQERGL